MRGTGPRGDLGAGPLGKVGAEPLLGSEGPISTAARRRRPRANVLPGERKGREGERAGQPWVLCCSLCPAPWLRPSPSPLAPCPPRPRGV